MQTNTNTQVLPKLQNPIGFHGLLMKFEKFPL